MDTHLSLGAFVCGAMELTHVWNILRKYKLTFLNDPEEFMFRASLEDFYALHMSMVNWIMMWNLAGILWWLP